MSLCWINEICSPGTKQSEFKTVNLVRKPNEKVNYNDSNRRCLGTMYKGVQIAAQNSIHRQLYKRHCRGRIGGRLRKINITTVPLMLIYDFIDTMIVCLYKCLFITLVRPYPACALTVTKGRGTFCNLFFLGRSKGINTLVDKVKRKFTLLLS